MSRAAVAGVWGALFGSGLGISTVARPDVVKGMLDVTGDWDPTMVVAWVVGASLYHAIYRWTVRRGRPVLGGQLSLPTKTRIDARLVVGAALFGAGWGIAGMCPGVVLVGLGTGAPRLVVFAMAMIAGMVAFGLRERRLARASGPRRDSAARRAGLGVIALGK